MRIGNLFDDIDDVSVEMDANLVMMGTHGLKGMQFITGGRALKIVRECSVPFIISQSRPNRETGTTTLWCLDLHQDTKQIGGRGRNGQIFQGSRAHHLPR